MRGAIAAPQPLAAEEGVRVLRQGGNAVDAALVAALVQGVIDPHMGGIGGGGSLVVYQASSGECTVIDCHGRAGAGARPDMWQDLVTGEWRGGLGYRLRDAVNDVGYQSITTPGFLAGVQQALERFGSISWKAMLEPAVALAAEGFTVTPDLARWLSSASDDPARVGTPTRLWATAESRRIFTRDGSPLRLGDELIQLDLARTLGRLAEEGADAFYHGEIAAIMAGDLEANGALVTADDLANYVARINLPVEARYRGLVVRSSPPPAGGVTLLQLLTILEAYDLPTLGHNTPTYVDLVARAMQATFTDRAMLVGDPLFVDVPVQALLSAERAEQWRTRIDARETITVPRWRPAEAPTTTHVTAVDDAGTCATFSHTLGASSGVVTPGLGFTYNNCMNGMDPIPGRPNSIAPGKSRLTGMCPTVVFRDGRPILALGGPGGTRAISAVLQTILNWADFGMSPVEAVSAPRFHCHGEVVDLEARIPRDVVQELQRRGHEVERSLHSYDAFFGLVHAVELDHAAGRPRPAADPRAGGAALVE